jgi:hypothetical protein
MLATLVFEPFDKPGWVYEEKYNGIWILANKEGSKITLLSRNDKDRKFSWHRCHHTFPTHTLFALELSVGVKTMDFSNRHSAVLSSIQ